MPYSEQTWTDLPATPPGSKAARFQHIEDGVAAGGGGTGNVSGSVNGVSTSLTLWVGTDAQYAAISVKDSNTVYITHA